MNNVTKPCGILSLYKYAFPKVWYGHGGRRCLWMMKTSSVWESAFKIQIQRKTPYRQKWQAKYPAYIPI
jgi:hypothetical protein